MYSRLKIKDDFKNYLSSRSCDLSLKSCDFLVPYLHKKAQCAPAMQRPSMCCTSLISSSSFRTAPEFAKEAGIQSPPCSSCTCRLWRHSLFAGLSHCWRAYIRLGRPSRLCIRNMAISYQIQPLPWVARESHLYVCNRLTCWFKVLAHICAGGGRWFL